MHRQSLNRQIILLTFLALTMCWVCGPAAARNPELSSWTKNLSESTSQAELGEYDSCQEIEVVGNTVHTMWITQNADWSGYRLYYRRSTDNGQTWEPKQLLFSKNDLNVDKTYKRMVVVGQTVHIAVNYYSGSWYGVLGYLRSTDNGASFEPIRSLFNAANVWHVLDVYIAASGGTVTIGVRNQCNWCVNNSVEILNTVDGGATFTRHTVYSTDTGGGWKVSDLQRVGDAIYVLYTDSYSYYGLQYSRLYLAASANNGTSFTSNLISVPSANGSHKTYALQNEHYVPKIAGVGGTVSVIWSGLDGDDVLSIFVRRSTNSGTSFEAAVNLTRDEVPEGKVFSAGQETLASRGNYVYCLFVTTASDVYLRRSLDSGANFQSLQTLTATPGTYYVAAGWWPVIVTDPNDHSGATVHVLWDWPIYCFSTDGGASFSKPELVTPYFSYSGSLTSGANAPYMAVGQDGSVHFVVQARYYANSFGSYGDYDIFYRGLSPPPEPSGTNNGLHLVTNVDDARYDNMQIPANASINFTDQMTGEVWVRPYPGGVTTGTNSAVKPIFHKDPQGYNFSYALHTWDYYGKRQAAAQITTTGGNFWLNPTSTTTGLVPDGTWTHLAFTYNANSGAGNFKLYVNGQLIATATATGNLATGDGPFFVGKYGIWDVAELRLWNRALTQAEIAANRMRRLTGNEPGLNAYYTFKNTTRDITGHGNDGILMYMEHYMRQNIGLGGLPAVDLLLLGN